MLFVPRARGLLFNVLVLCGLRAQVPCTMAVAVSMWSVLFCCPHLHYWGTSSVWKSLWDIWFIWLKSLMSQRRLMAVLVAVSKRCKKGLQKFHGKFAKWGCHLILSTTLLLNFRLPLTERNFGLGEHSATSTKTNLKFWLFGLVQEAKADEAICLRSTYLVRDMACQIWTSSLIQILNLSLFFSLMKIPLDGTVEESMAL